MPIYEYICKDCKAEFEALVPFSQADKAECEKCGSSNTERIASTFCCQAASADSAGVSGGGTCFSGG